MPVATQLKAVSPQQTVSVNADLNHSIEQEESYSPESAFTAKVKLGDKWQSPDEANGQTKTDGNSLTTFSHNFLRIPVHPNTTPFIQPKLMVNTPGDVFEQEADAISEKVMSMPDTVASPVRPSTPQDYKGPFGGKETELGEEKEGMESESIKRMIKGKSAPGGGEDKGKNIPPITSAVERALQMQGQPLDSLTRVFMERKFGFDFGSVRIHDDAIAHRSAKDVNAKAYTHGNHVVFGEGQHKPGSHVGRSLLAHELVHVVQQNGHASKMIQRNSPAPTADLVIQNPGHTLDENLYFLNSTTPSNVTRLGVMTPGLLKVYAVNGKEGTTLLKTYKIKSAITPPGFLYILQPDGFYIYGYSMSQEKELFIGKRNNDSSPEAKKIIEEWGSSLIVDNWFENKADLDDFVANHQRNQFFGLWVNSGSGQSGAGAGGGDQPPPMPAWMKPYAENVRKLIKEKRTQEPGAKDLPDTFNFYYSKQFKKYRATSKHTDDKKKIIQVYLDVIENAPEAGTLDFIRTKIRLKGLSGFDEPVKSDKSPESTLKNENLWALELLLGLRKKIKEERNGRPDRYDLPDAIHLTSINENPNELYLAVSANITVTNAEGVASSEAKTARLPDVLRREMTVEGVMPVVQSITLALREDRTKREIDPKKEKSKFTKILSAYPAEIIALDTREDFIGVKGGVGNYSMRLKFEGYETGLTNNMLANMQSIHYRWYAFRVSDFLDSAEMEKLAAIKDWKERRKLLVSQFQYKTLRQDSHYTWLGGWEWGADGEVKLPNEEGDVVVYGQAFVQPQGDTYRIPSEAFFPVHLVDGYALAKQGVNAPEKYLQGKKDELAQEKAKGDNASKDLIKNLEAEIASLEAVKGRSMLDNVKNSYDDTNKALKYAKLLKKILKDHPLLYAEHILSAKDEKLPIGAELFQLFLKIVSEDTRSVTPIEKVDSAITKISAMAEGLKGITDRAEKFKGEIKGNIYSPLTTFVSNKTATQYNLLMMLAESNDLSDYHYMAMHTDGRDGSTASLEEYAHRTVMVLIDITSEGTQRKYKGISDNPDKQAAKIEATKNAYIEFSKKAVYGTGFVHYKVPGLIDSEEGVDIASAPGTWEQIKQALAIIAAVAGVVALVVGTVASGGALGAAAVALGLGAGAIGAGLAIENIADRVENHTFKYDAAFAMDVLNIVGFFVSATKLIGASKLARAADSAADLAAVEKVAVATIRFETGFMTYQRIETVTNLVLTSYQTAKDIEAIESSGLPENQKSAMRMALLRNALLSGVMIAVSVKDSMKPIPTLADEMSRLLKLKMNSRKYAALNKELGLMDEHGNWLIPEMKKSAETQETRFTEAEAAEHAKSQVPETAPKEAPGTTAPEVKPAPEAGGTGLPPVKPPVKPPKKGGGGGGKPKKPKLDAESKKAVEEIDAKIADLKKRQDAGDTGAAFYIDSLKQAKDSIMRNPGSETVANARNTLTDLAATYPGGNIVVGLPDHFKQNGKKIAGGDKAAILEFLGQAKTWKDGISFLQGKGKAGKKALEAVQSYREGVQRELNSTYQAAELPNASTKPESDKDLNFPGENAGANLIKAEAEMRAKYGDDWSAKLRMNFYTEGDRLILFEKEGGNLPESARLKMEAELASLSDKLSLAKMLKHAAGDAASTKRVEKLIDTSLPHEAASIKELAKMPPEAVLARRNALHMEVDGLKKQYNNSETPVEQRPLIAGEITKKQIEINYLTEEAYISPAALKIINNPDAVLTPKESVSAVLANLEMIEHILHQSAGDVAVAARQYEIYKYMLRASKSMQHAQKDLYFDQLNKLISQVDREGAKNWTPGQLKGHYNDFMQHVSKFLTENQHNIGAIENPNPAPPSSGGSTVPKEQLELPLNPIVPPKPKPAEVVPPSDPGSPAAKPESAQSTVPETPKEKGEPKPGTTPEKNQTPETPSVAKAVEPVKTATPVDMKKIGAVTDPPQFLNSSDFSKVKLDPGHDALYILRDAKGTVLKVGKTSSTGAKGRFAVYKRAGKLTGRDLTLEVHQLKPSEFSAEHFESALRSKMVSEGHEMLWDNTGQRLGYPGFGTPGEGRRTPPVTRGEMEELLIEYKGNLKEIGKELGIHQRTADLWAKSHGLNPQDYK